jgi:hypothetical protein
MAVGAQLEPEVVFASAIGQTVEGLPYIEVLGTGETRGRSPSRASSSWT